ncbi:MAG: DNA translocase FtsK 4TM domain-containing protein [Candidatus Omnitrophota bacterium]
MRHLSSFLKSISLILTSFLIFLSLISYTSKDILFLSFPGPEKIANLIGIIGAYLSFSLLFIFGYAAYFFPFCFFFLGLDRLKLLRFRGLGRTKAVNIAAFICFIVFLSAFIGLFIKDELNIFKFSGIIGFFLSDFFKKYLGIHGSILTITLLMAVNVVLFFGFFFVDFVRGINNLMVNLVEYLQEFKKKWRIERIENKRLKQKAKQAAYPHTLTGTGRGGPLPNTKPKIKVYTPKAESASGAGTVLAAQKSVTKEQAEKKIRVLESQEGNSFDPNTYKLPVIGLLKVPSYSGQKEAKEDIKSNIKDLENTLLDFGVEAKVVSVQKGPVVTLYELAPQPGTKIQKFSALSDDIALSMKSSQVRIIAPMPGRGTVGIEIPNITKQFVSLREVLEEKAFTNASSKLTLTIGKDVSGNPVVADLNDMPHLLIAGATGAGKTVCVNALISSILFKAKPDEVKFIMVDPKMVELASFTGIPHLIHPIISEAKKAFLALNWAVEEMERRYKVLAKAGCRNIDLYNKGDSSPKLPYIVVVVDELADLMIVARESIETAIQRLAQLSRAVGIHLILATQRPSVDVITGVIKANFPARISFKVASKVDSRTVLDKMGADKLLGNGDLLFLKPGALDLIRAQGSYIDDEDIGALTDFIRSQGKPVYEDAISEGSKKHASNLGSDELFDDAVQTILRVRQASASLLQRRLRVGYTRAARLLDLMEQENIVGPFCGSKAREILVDPESYLIERYPSAEAEVV